jgi:methionyl-tRNA synthetase
MGRGAFVLLEVRTVAGKTYYITTPIYYVNDVPHIGHAYTTIAADVAARFKRLAGYDTYFLTGTDEHGLNIERVAKEHDVGPQEWTDRIAAEFKKLWQFLNISNDDFIRTTEPRHKRVAASLFQALYDKGDIYLGKYEGWYCTSCESFYLESELGPDKTCPIHTGRKVEWTAEESYLFRLSKYQDWWLRHVEEHPSAIEPESRRNEVTSFVRSGLKDLSVSRSTFTWGVPVPFDRRHVIYVWIDALTNYISALEYPDGELFRRYWPADVHLVGKEIVRFHAVYWPILLHAAGIEVPIKTFAHGWLTFGGQRFSKSLGIVIDPKALSERLADRAGVKPQIAVDALRYFLSREISFGGDGDFNEEALVQRYNSDLANDYGNLLQRLATQVHNHFKGTVPARSEDPRLFEIALNTVSAVERSFDVLDLTRATESISKLLYECNRYIDQERPWSRVKSDRKRAENIVYNSLEVVRIATILLSPWLPVGAEQVWERLGISEPIGSAGLRGAKSWGLLKEGTQIKQGPPIFPRIETGLPVEIRTQVFPLDQRERQFLEDYREFGARGRTRALEILSRNYRLEQKRDEKFLLYLLAVEQFGLLTQTFEAFFVALRDRHKKPFLWSLQKTFSAAKVVADFEAKSAQKIYEELQIDESKFPPQVRPKLRQRFEQIIQILLQISPHNRHFVYPILDALKQNFLVYRNEFGVPTFLLHPDRSKIIEERYAHLVSGQTEPPDSIDFLNEIAKGFEEAIKDMISVRLWEAESSSIIG